MVSWPSFSLKLMAPISCSIRAMAWLPKSRHTIFNHGRSRHLVPHHATRRMFLDKPTGPPPDPGAGLLSHLGMMARALLASPVPAQLFILGGGVAAIVRAAPYAQIRRNRRNS